jgi:hypothetical protein
MADRKPIPRGQGKVARPKNAESERPAVRVRGPSRTLVWAKRLIILALVLALAGGGYLLVRVATNDKNRDKPLLEVVTNTENWRTELGFVKQQADDAKVELAAAADKGVEAAKDKFEDIKKISLADVERDLNAFFQSRPDVKPIETEDQLRKTLAEPDPVVRPARRAEPAKPVRPEPVRPPALPPAKPPVLEPIKPIPVEPTKPVEPVKPIEPTRPVPPEPVKPVKPEPAKPEPVKPRDDPTALARAEYAKAIEIMRAWKPGDKARHLEALSHIDTALPYAEKGGDEDLIVKIKVMREHLLPMTVIETTPTQTTAVEDKPEANPAPAAPAPDDPKNKALEKYNEARAILRQWKMGDNKRLQDALVCLNTGLEQAEKTNDDDLITQINQMRYFCLKGQQIH